MGLVYERNPVLVLALASTMGYSNDFILFSSCWMVGPPLPMQLDLRNRPWLCWFGHIRDVSIGCCWSRALIRVPIGLIYILNYLSLDIIDENGIVHEYA